MKRGYSLYEALLVLGAIVAVGMLGALLVASANADGRVDFCYSRASDVAGQGYEIVGHRQWRPDVTMGYAPTPDAADKLIRESVVCSPPIAK